MSGKLWKSLTTSLSLTLLLTASCAASTAPEIVSYAKAMKEVEGKVYVPKKIEDEKDFQEGASTPIPKGAKITYAGKDGQEVAVVAKSTSFVIDKDRAVYYALLKARRTRLRDDLQTASKKGEVDKRILMSTVDNLLWKLEKKSTWWQRNKAMVAFVTGTVIGMAIVTGLVYALTKGNGTSTSTNVHLLPQQR